jgi:N-methylhydantoinase A
MMVGVDVGGTFTDVIAFDPASGRIQAGKVPSTTMRLTQGFLNGLGRLELKLNTIHRLLHGTTVATNAAIERKGARTAGVFTCGFRDVLAVGTGQRFTGGLFEPAFRRAPPLIPRSLALEVPERINCHGAELRPLDIESLGRVCAALREAKVESVAVCFLHSYAADGHERAAEGYLRELLPGAFVCRSSDVLPQIREYERFTTTVFNAYLGPVVQRYLSALERQLAAMGFPHELLLMTSNGGVVSASHATRYPVTTVLSGPAGGVSAGLYLGRTLGVRNLITYDMGGTSTDVCLIRNLYPALASQRIVSGLPLRMPQIDINTIGAGGGSIACVATDGTFSVGPHSAGAVPGPACYGRGGTQPTVTDANLILGRLGATSLLGGALGLHVEPARAAIAQIADAIGGGSIEKAAEGMIRIAVSNMAGAIREISIERGEDPRPFTLVAFGGAGPMHGCEVADEVGIRRIIVPLYPGNFSALGLLLSDLRHEFVRSSLARLEDADLGTIAATLREMGEGGRRLLAAEGARHEDMSIQHQIGMRFLGQAYNLAVDVDPGKLDREDLERRFRALYVETWAHEPGITAIQFVNLRVTAIGKAPRMTLPSPAGGTINGAKKETRPAWFGGAFRDTAVYDRGRLPAAACFAGPAIVDEDGATTVIPPGWSAAVHASGHLFLERA